jgi:hypothetical protein
MLAGYVVDPRRFSSVFIEHHPAHPARIPAPGFRLLYDLCSPFRIGYNVDIMMVI